MSYFAKKIWPGLLLALTVLLSGCSSSQLPPPKVPKVIKELHPTIQVVQKWSRSVNDGAGKNYLELMPAVSHDRFYTVDYRGEVSALSATGHDIWRRKVPVHITSGVSVGDGLVVVSGNARVFALDEQTGKVLWQQDIPNEVFAPAAIGNGAVVLKTIDGQLVALSAQNGHLLWHYEHGAPSLILRASSSPVLVGNRIVLAGYDDGKVAAYQLANGKIIWESILAMPMGASSIQRMVDIDATPVVDDQTAFVGTYQGNIAAIQVPSGRMLWRHDFSTNSGLAYHQGVVYATDAAGDIWAFDAVTGNVLWRQRLLVGHMLTAPALQGNSIVIADAQGHVYWLNQQNGQFQAYLKISSGPIWAPPVVANDIAYVQAASGRIFAFTIKSAL